MNEIRMSLWMKCELVNGWNENESMNGMGMSVCSEMNVNQSMETVIFVHTLYMYQNGNEF